MHSLLFGLFASLFVYQVLRIPYQSIHVIDWAKFILPLLLVPINWYLEYKKWYLQLNFLKLPLQNAHKSFAAGMVSDFIIPGIPTNFVGRIMYFDSSKRDHTYRELFYLFALDCSTLYGFFRQFVAISRKSFLGYLMVK
jgi:hypothetical protein